MTTPADIATRLAAHIYEPPSTTTLLVALECAADLGIREGLARAAALDVMPKAEADKPHGERFTNTTGG